MKFTISILGSGNMAFQLGKALLKAGQLVMEIYSRNEIEGKKLADLLETNFIQELKNLKKADIYILAIKDDAVLEISKNIPGYGSLLIHTAGSISINNLQNKKHRKAVLYPVQTLSKNKEIDFSQIPICIEAELNSDLEILKSLSILLSNKIYEINSEQRKVIHIAAVFACNFPNYLYTAAKQILEKGSIPFDIIRPLIMETALKVQNLYPENTQTGPAIRDDQTVLKSHEEFLQNNPDLLAVYQLLSDKISKSRI